MAVYGQDDGSVLPGNRNVSSVCARIVQISYGMSREQILRALEVFGEVIAIFFEIKVVGSRLGYTGV
eukprot:9248785-Karenia_brevis.AAC.1